MKKRKLKPQVKAILIIFGIIAFFILFENVVNWTGSFIKNWKAQREYEKQQEIYQNSPEYKEERFVADSIQTAIEYVKNENYEALYELLDPDYKDAYSIDSVDVFKDVLKKYIGENVEKVVLVDHYWQSNKYTCEISVYTGSSISNKTMIVTPTSDDKFYVILDDVEKIEKFAGRFNSSNSLAFQTLVYRVETDYEKIMIVDIENRTENKITVSMNDTVLEKSDGSKCPLLNSEDVSGIVLEPKETKRVKFVFSSQISPLHVDKGIHFSFKTDDGNVVNNTMDLTFYYWE